MSLPTRGAGPSALVSYLLRATFDAANQGYADAQVLDTVAEGVQEGQLTVVEVDGTLAIVSNKCAFTAASAYGNLGYSSGAITKALGRALLATLNLTTWEEMGIGLDNAATVVDPDNMTFGIQAHTTDGQLDAENATAILTGLSTSTDYKLAIVLGGYDSNEVPWYSGQAAASYLYGAAYFYYDGSDWHLLWRKATDNTGTLYAMLSVFDGVGTIDNFRVPDRSYQTVLQPTCLSTFTAANGTSLDAITPEVGGAWTEQSGDWDIDNNRATDDVTANNTVARATVDSGVSDCIVDVTARGGTYFSMAVRYSDSTHLWLIELAESENEVTLYEINGGATSRASTSVPIFAGTDYDIRAICDGQTIDAFVDGGNKISYASAALNETATMHGLSRYRQADEYDNFAVYPRTSSAYSVLDRS